MLLPCRYYHVNSRMFSGVMAFSQEPGFWFCCLSGNVAVNKGTFKALTPEITLMVGCYSSEARKPIIAILTTDSRYSEYNGKKIDTDNIMMNNIYMLVCTLLKDKFANTGNAFTLTFTGEGSSLEVEAEMFENAPRLKAVIKIPTGEAIITGDRAVGAQLDKVSGIKAFRYSTVNAAVEKEVVVRKCYGEILREIAHYLNRTLVLICQSDKQQVIEQVVNAVGSAELCTKPDGTKFYRKVSAASLQEYKTLGVYTTTSSVDEILREQGRILKR